MAEFKETLSTLVNNNLIDSPFNQVASISHRGNIFHQQNAAITGIECYINQRSFQLNIRSIKIITFLAYDLISFVHYLPSAVGYKQYL